MKTQEKLGTKAGSRSYSEKILRKSFAQEFLEATRFAGVDTLLANSAKTDLNGRQHEKPK